MFEKEKKQYEEDCKTHERPFELWQYTSRDQSSPDWHSLETHPKWSKHCIYHRKQTSFMTEYYSGINWRDAEHLVGKTVECTNNPDYEWEVGLLRRIVPIGKNFDVSMHFYTYIRTCEETFKHPTINIGGVELPKPETVAPNVGDQYWVCPSGCEPGYLLFWTNDDDDIAALRECRVHLTIERAQAWADWWKTAVIDKMK